MPSSAWRSTLFPYTTLFRSDRKSTRLNSSHDQISYAVFCLKKKKPTVVVCFGTNREAHSSDCTERLHKCSGSARTLAPRLPRIRSRLSTSLYVESDSIGFVH